MVIRTNGFTFSSPPRYNLSDGTGTNTTMTPKRGKPMSSLWILVMAFAKPFSVEASLKIESVC